MFGKKKLKGEQKYWISIRVNDDNYLEEFSQCFIYENLTRDEAQVKLLEIKEKIEDGIVEIYGSDKRNLFNWRHVRSVYIEEE